MSLEDPGKARRLLLTGYRLQEKRLLFFSDKKLPKSGQYVARIVMKNIIQALSKPENSAMVSIFVPGELLTAAGLTPYSVEAMSCFIAGTRCEQTFLRKTEEEGFPETMCSYHRVFLGAALSGLVPKPKCMIYTNLACDSNMMTFPYLKQKNMLPGFFIDVPYDKNEDSVKYVADQLRELKAFLEDVTGKKISEEAVRQAVNNSNQAAAYYHEQLALRKEHDPVTSLTNELYAIFMCHLMAGSQEAVKYTKLLLEDVKKAVRQAVNNSNQAAAYYHEQLALRKEHDPVTSLTNELYAIFMCHLMAGSQEAVKYTKLLLEDVKKAPKSEGLHILWMHMMPFLQEPVKDIFNYSDQIHISACDFVADGLQKTHYEDPYESMAEKMVNCIYNGSVKQRIQKAKELAAQTNVDGGILFTHWGCKGTIGASSLIKGSLEEAGIPTMILDGDGCNPANSSDGQISTRLQAYMEMLKVNKAEKYAANHGKGAGSDDTLCL